MSKRPSGACKEAGDALTLGASDEIKTARARLHLKHCEDCRQDEQTVDEVRKTVLAVDDRLDDLTRARVQARLAEAMEQASRQGEARTASSNGRSMRVALAVAVTALLVAAASLIWRTDAPQVSEPLKSVAVKSPAPEQNNSVLQLHATMEGSAPLTGPHQAKLGEKVARLQLPAGVELKANLAQGAKLALYGPMNLAVKEADASHTELNLAVGSMVVDYDAGRGKLLRIVSPGAVTEVMGTLFSVEVRGSHTLVSVSRGKVTVHSGGATMEVLPGQTWSSEKKHLGQTPADSAALLKRHAGQSVSARRPGALPQEAAIVISHARPREGTRPSPTRHPTRHSTPASVPEPQAPSPAPAPAPAPEPASASALYAQAETALGNGDRLGARQIFSQILKIYPKDPLSDSARYELALLLVQSGRKAEAERILGQVGPAGGSSLQEPAHFLRCRIKQDSGQRKAAIGCFRSFRARYPASPHHPRALTELKKLRAQR